MSQEIIDHVQTQFDSMSREQIIQMINFDPEIDPVLDEAIAIWDIQLSQPHQPQDQQQQVQQQAQQEQQQIHPPIPAVENHIEDYNSDSDSLSVMMMTHWTQWNCKYSIFCRLIVLIAFILTLTMECGSDVTES